MGIRVAMLTNKEKFEKDMAVFSFKQHQEVLTYLKHLKTTEWTLEDVKQWVEQKKKSNKEARKKIEDFINHLRKCPGCKNPMQILPVNIDKGTQTGDNSKSVWICRNCLYTEYSTKTFEEQLKEKNKGF